MLTINKFRKKNKSLRIDKMIQLEHGTTFVLLSLFNKKRNLQVDKTFFSNLKPVLMFINLSKPLINAYKDCKRDLLF